MHRRRPIMNINMRAHSPASSVPPSSGGNSSYPQESCPTANGVRNQIIAQALAVSPSDLKNQENLRRKYSAPSARERRAYEFPRLLPHRLPPVLAFVFLAAPLSSPSFLGVGSFPRRSPHGPVPNTRRALSDMRIAAEMNSGATCRA